MSGQPLQFSRELPGIGDRERLVRRAKLLAWLGANALLGLWWADSVTALLIGLRRERGTRVVARRGLPINMSSVDPNQVR